MAVEVSLPRLGQGMEAGTIVRWLKSEGDTVEKGEALYELDTDKVTQEVEAEASGTLLKILAQEGAEIAVGKRIAVIGEQGEAVEDEAEDSKDVDEDAQEEGSPGPAREEEREQGREASAEEPKAEAKEAAPVDGRIKASPLARRVARERGIELAGLTGTGPEGRIVAEDVERAAATPAHATAGAGPARGRGRTAHVDPAHDCPPPDESLGGARIPDLDVGGHDAGHSRFVSVCATRK